MMLENIEGVFLQKDTIKIIANEAIKHLPKEACGLIGAQRLSDGNINLVVFPVLNKSKKNNRFLISDQDILSIQKRCKSLGYSLCGCYHSHPKGRDIPSTKDILCASKSNLKVWAIYSVRLNRLSIYNMGAVPIKIEYRIE